MPQERATDEDRELVALALHPEEAADANDPHGEGASR
jgi:hypothetical protein